MITFSNIRKHTAIDFADYLAFQGYSHSFLKSNVCGIPVHVEETTNMRMGSQVDAILTDTRHANMADPVYPHAKAIASDIQRMFGDMLGMMEKQVSYTAELEMQGFVLPVKGRLDYLLPGHFVLDLKVTRSKDVDAIIRYMNYLNQVWVYAGMAGVTKAYLLMYSVPLKHIELRQIDVTGDNAWWADKIRTFGRVAA